jgi:TFIIF-interacting CTD phosphatase-like protein
MSKKWNVLLDLDQTLISGEEYKGFKHENRLDKFEVKLMDKEYIVFARPHLQQFLDFLFKYFNVSVWTAASKSYALFIIDNFILTKPNRRLDFMFFSYHCNYSVKCKKGLKGLNVLWENFKLTHYNESNTIIIDDNPEVKSIQKCNCYNIKPFYALKNGSENDTALVELEKQLVGLLSTPKINQCLIKNF